jgi:eukaryotic-like serine/threonine-protein kinase
MGVVYRARDDGLERDVALKVMAMRDATAEARERFLREARSVARLQHPNIVIIYELGEHDGAPFMAMELLEGLDVQRAIAAGLPPDPRVTLPIVMQLLAGLGHAHEHGIVHRDVKPSNVFLPRGRPAKVMDFGVARLAAGTTASGIMVGTPNYMSPEQVRTGLVDGRSDLFSAGLILYELVTGEKVYRSDNVVSLLYKIAHEDPALAELPAGPQWERLRKVIARALARQPEDRYPDARAMSDDLARALEDFGGAAPGPPSWDEMVLVERTAAEPPAGPPPVAPAAEPSRRLAFAALGAAVLALIVGAGLFVWLRPPAPAPQTEASPSTGTPASIAPAPPSPSIASAAPPAASPAPPAAFPSLPSSPAAAAPRPTPERAAPAAAAAEGEARRGRRAAGEGQRPLGSRTLRGGPGRGQGCAPAQPRQRRGAVPGRGRRGRDRGGGTDQESAGGAAQRRPRYGAAGSAGRAGRGPQRRPPAGAVQGGHSLTVLG